MIVTIVATECNQPATVEHVLNDNRYLAYALDFNTEEIEFIRVTESEFRSLPWLRRDAFAQPVESHRVALSQLEKFVELPLTQPVAFVFHTAYCGSTFVSRALDLPGIAINLREPQLLLDVANAKRGNWEARSCNMDYQRLMRLAMNLLLRHGQDQTTVIKPVNSINNIALELMQLMPSAKALMLYTDAKNFLLSTLKKGEAARQTTRAMFDLTRCDFPHLSALRLTDTVHMTDLKLILTLWRLQLEQANAVLSAVGSDRMRSLYAERLIENPHATLLAGDAFLQTGLGESNLVEFLEKRGKHDAKDMNQSFSAEKRANRYAEIEAFFGDDLNNGLQWLSANNPQMPLIPALAHPL